MSFKSSRKEAKSVGDMFYFTGKKCVRGHIDKRRTSTGTCISCSSILNSRYTRDSEQRKSYMREYLVKYQKENHASVSLNKKKYAQKNIEKGRERSRKRRIENKDYYYQKCAERRAKKKKAIPLWFDKGAVSKVYAMASKYGFEVDHVVPITSEIVCGLHTWENLQLLNRSENAKKLNVFWPDMPGDL